MSDMMPRGTYWVGDLCYVLTDANGFDWQDVLDQSDFFAEDISVVTKCNGTRVKVACMSTLYGDGEYSDQYGNRYPVDAGIIGCVPIEFIDTSAKEATWGNIFTFPQGFRLEKVEGTLFFGYVEIETGDDECENNWDDEDY